MSRFEAVDSVIAYDEHSGLQGLFATWRQLRRRRYTMVIDLHRSLRSSLIRRLLASVPARTVRKGAFRRFLLVRFRHGKGGKWPTAIDRYLACLPADSDIADSDKVPRIRPSESARTEAKRILATYPSQEPRTDLIPYIALAPGARWPTKRWPAERFVDLGRQLVKRFAIRIVAAGGVEDRSLCDEVAHDIGPQAMSVAGRTSLEQAAAILELSSLLITNDTGLMHLATAVGTRSLAIFGPTTRELGFYPPDSFGRVLERSLPCRPCSTKGSRTCPIGTHECMLDIPVGEALKEAITLLERTEE